MLIIITLGRTAHAWLAYANHLKLPRVIQAKIIACLKIRNYNSLNIIFTCAFILSISSQTHVIEYGTVSEKLWGKCTCVRSKSVSNEKWVRETFILLEQFHL